MNLSEYDDMMGLEFGDYEGLDQFLNAEMIKEALLASVAGGGAILLTTYGVRKAVEKIGFINQIQDPLAKAAVTSGLAFIVGLAGGRMLYEYNREAAMGVIGGVGGIAMANLIDAAIAKFTGNERMGIGLGDGDESLLSAYSDQEGMEALAALESTGVTSAPGAFQGFADPSVTPEALMGLQGTIVQEETLGDMGAYAPYLS